MIYLIHGEDISKTRALIVNQQNKLGVKNKIEIDSDTASPGKLSELIHTKSLFGETPFVVFDITEIPASGMENYYKVVTTIPDDSTLVVISSKSLPKNNWLIKNPEKLKIKVIKNEKIPDSNVFRFLDYLGSKNRKAAYQELAKLIKNDTDGIYLITMMQFFVRNISLCVFDSPKFEELKPFIQSKTKRQAKNFSKDAVKNIYNSLYDIEKKAKTGLVQPLDGVTLAVEKVLNS